MRHWLYVGIAGLVLLGGVSGAMAQRGQVDLTVEAGPSLGPLADRVRNIDRQPLAVALAQAGLSMPPQVRVTLIAEDDARARETPRWIVGLAFGSRDVAIFPARVGPYPYDSLESVFSHEVVHLALAAQAGAPAARTVRGGVEAGGPLPRWFHEGVATSVEQGWSVTSQARLLFATVGNPDLADLGRLFASASEPETVSAYLLAAALVSDIRERHGAASPGAIIDRVARGETFARAFRLETGDTPDQAAARAWGPYRQWTSWILVATSGSALWIGIMGLAFIAFLASLRKRALRRRQWDEWDGDA